jgi:sugar lactone lactonase YvrE
MGEGMEMRIQNNNSRMNAENFVGSVSTLAGSGKEGSKDGTGNQASFKYPQGICFNESGQSLLVCDSGNDLIRRVSLTGILKLIL